MPIPLILGALAVGAGVLGVKKTIDAISDNSDANDINADAEQIYSNAKEKLQNRRTRTETALETLGKEKLSILDGSVTRFVKVFEQLHNVDFTDSVGLEELKNFRLDKQSLLELKEMSAFATSMLGGLTGGAAGGALAAFGAYSGVMALGAASTGTAIAGLTGVAATNATLAFLGGGSLAAGGLGMAGGAAVLGGLVAGPALAVMGFWMGAKASENLDNARSNRAQARKIAEEMEAAGVLCDGISERSAMFKNLLLRLDEMLSPLIGHIQVFVEKKHASLTITQKLWRFILRHRRVEYSSLSAEQKHTVVIAASLAKAIKTVIDTPILSQEGNLTNDSERIVETITSDLDAGKYQIVNT
ncbi:hypothetical protein FACS1894107_14740 [Planctomycetales bacterium]|nr:hypothetical protein FACS1894107_14740 [Planctomycetales bacterium]GHS98568.1 hypothetical protein FACS1894108_06960 [Planctomycetales bacterium]